MASNVYRYSSLDPAQYRFTSHFSRESRCPESFPNQDVGTAIVATGELASNLGYSTSHDIVTVAYA